MQSLCTLQHKLYKYIFDRKSAVFSAYVFMYNVHCVQYKMCILCSVHDSLYTFSVNPGQNARGQNAKGHNARGKNARGQNARK